MSIFTITKVFNIRYFVITVLTIIVGVIIICFINKKVPYESRYFEKLGVNRIKYLYNDMINDFGKPNEVIIYEEKGNWTEAKYNDFIMSFWTNAPNSQLTNIRITSKKYRFGWCSIGVGSTKREVEKAYKNTVKSNDSNWTYIDGKIYIEFIFDVNDFVEEIKFFDYSHF